MVCGTTGSSKGCVKTYRLLYCMACVCSEEMMVVYSTQWGSKIMRSFHNLMGFKVPFDSFSRWSHGA